MKQNESCFNVVAMKQIEIASTFSAAVGAGAATAFAASSTTAAAASNTTATAAADLPQSDEPECDDSNELVGLVTSMHIVSLKRSLRHLGRPSSAL